jgi:hypothetical protein
MKTFGFTHLEKVQVDHTSLFIIEALHNSAYSPEDPPEDWGAGKRQVPGI